MLGCEEGYNVRFYHETTLEHLKKKKIAVALPATVQSVSLESDVWEGLREPLP